MHRRLLRGSHRARGRRHRGGAAPVRGLRRVHDGVPVRRADLRLSVGAGPRRARHARCSPPTRRRAGATHASCCMPKMRARRSRIIARRGSGLPARVIPFEIHHIASTGIDVWLAALAWGASQVAVLVTGDEAPQYVEALAFQMRVADTIANALGYQGEHFRLVPRRRARRAVDVAPALGVAHAGHVRCHAREAHDRGACHRAPRHARARAAGGRSRCPRARRTARSRSTRHACTMCLACVGLVPGGGDPRQRRGAAGPLHRDQVRPMRHLRRDLSGARDQPRAAARPHARGARRRAC